MLSLTSTSVSGMRGQSCIFGGLTHVYTTVFPCKDGITAATIKTKQPYLPMKRPVSYKARGLFITHWTAVKLETQRTLCSARFTNQALSFTRPHAAVIYSQTLYQILTH